MIGNPVIMLEFFRLKKSIRTYVIITTFLLFVRMPKISVDWTTLNGGKNW